jgi:hypothetical protein
MNKPLVRSILAVLVGYLVLAVGIGVTDFVISLFSPGGYPSGPHPEAKWMVVELVVGAILILCGGYLTASLARRRETHHALALGIVTAAIAAVSLIIYRSLQPAWFQLVVALIAIPAALAGGRLKTRQ